MGYGHRPAARPGAPARGSVYGAVFNRDESRILTWSDDKTARLWDAGTGQPLGPALQHEDAVRGAVFSRDESRILTWSTTRRRGCGMRAPASPRPCAPASRFVWARVQPGREPHPDLE